jgi:hypothetical protein
MLNLLLVLACGLPATTPIDTGDTADSAPAEDTAPEVIYWTKYKVDTAATLRGVYSSGAGVYLVGSHGQAWVGSATSAWATYALPVELAGADVNGLWGAGSGDSLQLAVAADNGLVAVFTGGVWTVSSLGTGSNLAIDGTSISNLYVVGENGIHHFDGVVWTLEVVPTLTMNAVWAYDSGAFAAGDEGTVLRRVDSVTWPEVETNKAANLYGIAGVSASDVWVSGDQGVVLHYNGSGWTQTETGSTETLNGLYMPAAGTVLAVGNDGATLKNSGTGWTLLANETNQNLYAIHGVSGSNAWAVGNGGLAMQFKEE